MCFVNDDCLQVVRIKFLRPIHTCQGLISGDSTWSCQTIGPETSDGAYTSAKPVAQCLVPCSISTDHLGNSRAACSADCLASSMLLTMTSDRVAFGFEGGEGIWESKERKTVVFPEPVGRDTPILVMPDARASRQDWIHSFWYDLRTTGFALTSAGVFSVAYARRNRHNGRNI